MRKKNKVYISISLSLLFLYALWLAFIFDAFAFIDLLTEWRQMLLDNENTLVLLITVLSTAIIGIPSVVMIFITSADKLESLEKCKNDVSNCENEMQRLEDQVKINYASFKYIRELDENTVNKIHQINHSIYYFEGKAIHNVILSNEINKNIHKICKHSKLAKDIKIKGKLQKYQSDFNETIKSYSEISD